jgi:hypothetical protein
MKPSLAEQYKQRILAGSFGPLMAAAMLLLAVSSVASADERLNASARSTNAEAGIHPVLRDPFFFSVGALWASTSTDAYYGRTEVFAVKINFEDTLGMQDDDVVLNATFFWRFAQRWRLEVSYFEIERTGRQRIREEISWGDDVYPVNSNIDSRFFLSDLRVVAGYWFFREPDKELGAGIGLHTMRFDAKISASGVGEERGDALAPLPVLAFYSNIALNDRWAMMLRVGWLSLSYEDYHGDLSTFGLDFVYQPAGNIGIGVGWRDLRLDVDYESNGALTGLRVDLRGPAVFINVSF